MSTLILSLVLAITPVGTEAPKAAMTCCGPKACCCSTCVAGCTCCSTGVCTCASCAGCGCCKK